MNQVIAERNGKPPPRPDPLPWRGSGSGGGAIPNPRGNLYIEVQNQLAAKLYTRHCSHCGEAIPLGTSYTNDGVDTYHATASHPSSAVGRRGLPSAPASMQI